MKRCKDCTKSSDCRRKNLPYAIAIPFSLFAAALTWITMNVIGLSPSVGVGVSVIALFVGGGAILAYVELSVSRHCIDDNRRERRLTT